MNKVKTKDKTHNKNLKNSPPNKLFNKIGVTCHNVKVKVTN